MKNYEIYIEDMTPCGGTKYSQKNFVEEELSDPLEYVRKNSRYPVIEVTKNENGDLLIITGNEKGYRLQYTFTE